MNEKLNQANYEEREFIFWFNAIQKEVHKTAVNHGFWVDTNRATVNVGEKLALIHSEISEALEASRKNYPNDKHCPQFGNFEVELADAIIRIMDLASFLEIDISEALIAKNLVNKKRPHKHGKAF